MGRILVTGAAGFIGHALTLLLLEQGKEVIGIDNLNDYYPVSLKQDRLKNLTAHPRFEFAPLDLCDYEGLMALARTHRPTGVVNLAAQVGVRYSLTNPLVYGQSNLVGFLNILELCRQTGVENLVFASSSSVYGANRQIPFREHDPVDHPISLYGASKRANELMAHSYAHLYNLPCTGLRFFTVYGPWGRPDMAMFLWTKAILAGEPIQLFNHGKMWRDFTYVDDIARGIAAVLAAPAQGAQPTEGAKFQDPCVSTAPYRIYNIGSHRPIELETVISLLEQKIGKKAIRQLAPMQPGDMLSTFAEVEDLAQATGNRAETSIEEGISRFVDWYRAYYQV